MRPETETLENGLPDWQCITHVLLDLDGTLLDKDFDDHLWQELVPMAYARENGISLQEAKTALYAAYMKEWGRLNWNDIDHWSALFGLEIVALQRSVASKVAMHPGVREFLEFVRAMGKPLHLVTNAHPKTLSTKMERIPLDALFDEVLSAFEVGYAKEEIEFWEEAQHRLDFDPETTVLVDDNVEALRAAEEFGVVHVLHKSRASSTRPPEPHPEFPSIEYFSELMTVPEEGLETSQPWRTQRQVLQGNS